MSKKLPRVAAIHDVSGYGKCALTTALPLISALGVEVCPLPTAILSSNTIFEDFTFFDFTPHIDAYLDHWQKLGLKFDAVYSGFLGSAKQMAQVARLVREFESGLAIIDPVMGDNGLVIKTYTPEMCSDMAGLVSIADLATPNITEAAILANRPYPGEELSPAETRDLAEAVKALGPKNVLLTGVQRGELLYNCILGQDGSYTELAIGHLPFHMHGTGDVFSSVVVGGLLRGFELGQCVDSAARFVHDVMEQSRDIEDIFARGPAFELLAWKLGSGLYQA